MDNSVPMYITLAAVLSTVPSAMVTVKSPTWVKPLPSAVTFP